MAASNLSIFESISKELRCDDDGQGFTSLRGLARMCGVKHNSWGRGGSKFTLQIDEYLLEGGIEVVASDFSQGIPDIIAAEVIGFYDSEKQNPTAKKYSRAFRAFGLRKAIQEATGYKPPIKPRLSPEEIIELCCLPCPTTWQRRFPGEYYEHLSRLTGLVANGVERPMLWARLTKELVYDYLPPGIYKEIKRCKAETGSWEKLHQFLSEDGVLVLETHQHRVLEHLQGAANLEQAKTSLRQACTKQYQLVLVKV
jgi:P63C domain